MKNSRYSKWMLDVMAMQLEHLTEISKADPSINDRVKFKVVPTFQMPKLKKEIGEALPVFALFHANRNRMVAVHSFHDGRVEGRLFKDRLLFFQYSDDFDLISNRATNLDETLLTRLTKESKPNLKLIRK